MKKLLLTLGFMAALLLLPLHAEVKMSPSTQNFLLNYKSATPAQQSKLKSRYAVAQNNGQMIVSAFLHLNDGTNLDGLDENQVVVNAQYGTILSVRIPADKLETVSQLPAVKYIEIGRPVRPLMNNVRSSEFCNVDDLHAGTGLTQTYTGKGVIVGIIDNGFQYNHINFYDSDRQNLRIKRVWNQNISGNLPTGFYYGTEYTTADEIIAAKQDFKASHATHVAGIAAGAYNGNDYYGIAPDADLVFVSYNIYDNSSSNTSISDGLKYIYDYAESVGKPCVVNMSLGTHIGPHDGSSTFDRICDELQGPGRLLVGAAGNEGDFNLHAQKTLTATDKTMKSLVDFVSYYGYGTIDIWGDANQPLSARVIVYDTRNKKEVYSSDSFSTATGTSKLIENPTGAEGKITIATATDSNNQKGNITIDLEISYFDKSYYYIGFEVTGPEGTTVNAWADGYDSQLANYGNSEFTNGDNSSTMGEIGGTGERIITVGAYTSCNYIEHKNSSTYNRTNETVNRLASFSSTGPTADGRMKPDITAPGSMVISSFNSSTCSRGGDDYSYVVSEENVNTVNYYYGSMEGTSMATPVVTGILATWLQARPDLTPEMVREVFARTAKTDGYTGSIAGTGNNQWGYGKIDAYNGLVYCFDLSGIDKTGAPTRPMVYPNPASGYCHFLLPDDDRRITASIYSLNGSEITSQYIGDVAAGEQCLLDLNGIPTGIYFVRITGEHTHFTAKLSVR